MALRGGPGSRPAPGCSLPTRLVPTSSGKGGGRGGRGKEGEGGRGGMEGGGREGEERVMEGGRMERRVREREERKE